MTPWQISLKQVRNAPEAAAQRELALRREAKTLNKRAERERKAQARRAQQKRTEDHEI